MTTNPDRTIIGLDVGEKRIGVARLHMQVKIAEPLDVIDASKQNVVQEIINVIEEYQAEAVVIGLPRGLDGQETDQTRYCQDFAQKLATEINAPVYMIDEAGTSKAADSLIGKDKSISRDSMAAAIILEDFANYSDQELLRVSLSAGGIHHE